MDLRSRWCSPRSILTGVTVLALIARMYALGARVAHQDEARVADWTLHYMASGTWQYRPIIHGPFLPHINGVVFSLLGPSDFTMRLVVAIIGGILPLAAYLYRDYLDDLEVVVFGVLLAGSPALLYYSRFMRNDAMVAACMIAALGLGLRAHATGHTRYLYAGTFVFALAFTMKGTAILYLVAWIGSVVLTVDRYLLLAHDRGTNLSHVIVGRLGGLFRELRPWGLPLLLSVIEFVTVIAVFYSPLPALYSAFSSTGMFIHVVDLATVGAASKFVGTWTGAGMSKHSTALFLGRILVILGLTGTVTCLGAIIGFLRERYGTGETRALVEFAFFWGVLSVLGYAIITDVLGGWVAVSILAPLTIPAAVGLAWIARTGYHAYIAGDVTIFRAAAAILLIATAIGGGTSIYTSYVAPQEPSNPLVQYAQPAGHMKPTLAKIRTISTHHPGIDIMFYGSSFSNPTDLQHQPTLNIQTGGYNGWFQRLPLPWYFDQYGARVASTTSAHKLQKYHPPVIITLQKHEAAVRSTITMNNYTVKTYQGYQHGRPLVFFVQTTAHHNKLSHVEFRPQ